MSDKSVISIVVPCHNEQEALPFFYDETTGVLAGLGRPYELLFVDDGSKDDTLKVLKGFAERDNHVGYLAFSRNFGKEAAMYAGLSNAVGDYVAIMDADLQDPPHLLPQMLSLLEEGTCDCVATRRASREGEPLVRSWCARLFYKVINCVSDAEIVDGARDFRLMRREMVDAVVAMGESNRFSKGIFGWVGFDTYWLSYENVERAAGQTKWSFWSLAKYATDGIINFSEAPLSIASWFGLAMTSLSLLAIAFIVVRKLIFGDPVDGWASTITTIIFMGGIQLFCMGVMGQYIARTYTEVKSRPHYVIAETNKPDVRKIG